jgi:YaiO family outer membrane protein
MPDLRTLMAWIAVSLFLAPRPGLRAAEPVTSYESAVLQAQQALQRGQSASAEPLFRTLLTRYPGNPEVLAGLVDSLCRQERYAEGLAAAALVSAGGTTAELERQRHRCEFLSRVADAGARPSSEANLESLRVLHEDWPDDPYTTGWLYARALEAQGHPDRAEVLYGRLAERYPADGDFARQRDRLQAARQLVESRASLNDSLRQVNALEADRNFLAAAAMLASLRSRFPDEQGLAVREVADLAAGHDGPRARAAYARLDGSGQQSAKAAMGGSLDALYPDSLTASVGGARYDRDSTDDSLQSLAWTRARQGHAITLAAERQQRFGQSSSSFAATLDTRLSAGYDGAFTLSWSPQGRFLPEYSVSADVGHYTGAGRAYVAVRQLSFENTSATLIAPGFLWEASERFRLDTRVYWVPRSDSWSVLVAPQWFTTGGHRTTLTISGGMASEQLDIVGGTLRASTYSVRLAQRWRLGNRWAVGGDVFHEHRAGLYNRTGATLQAVCSW